MHIPIVLQTQATECGIACLAMISGTFGGTYELAEIRRVAPVGSRGQNLEQLCRAAKQLGLRSRPLRIELEELKGLALPALLHWDLNHFVVLKSTKLGRIIIIDPAVGERSLRLNEVSALFSGVAVEFAPEANFKSAVKASFVTLSSLSGRVVGLTRSLAAIACVALSLQLFAIFTPMISQLMIDNAIAGGDRNFLLVLAVGFASLAVIQALLGMVRSWMILKLTQAFIFQWGGNLFTHLTRLPVLWFEIRSLAEITSRFGSIDTIQQTVTTRSIEAGIVISKTMLLPYRVFSFNKWPVNLIV